MSTDTPLFPASLISKKVQSELPEGFILRPLQRSDFHRGHLDALKDLVVVGQISEEQWVERFDWMQSCKDTYYTLVIVNEARGRGKEIVATGTLFAERKL